MTHGVLHLLHGRSEAGFFVPAAGHQRLDGPGQISDQRRPSSWKASQSGQQSGPSSRVPTPPGGPGRTGAGRLTSVDGPHDAEGGAADLVVGLLAGDDLPEDDGPAEHVALLTVVAACRGHSAVGSLHQ